MNHAEKRNLERFEFSLPGEVTQMNNQNGYYNLLVQKCLVRDISSDGAYFLTQKPLPIDTEVDVCFDLPPASANKQKNKRGLTEIKGVVVRTEEDGMAIRFCGPYKIRSYSPHTTRIPRMKSFGQIPLNSIGFKEEMALAACAT